MTKKSNHYFFQGRWEIAKPIEVVWSAANQFETWQKWWKGMRRVALLDSPAADKRLIGFTVGHLLYNLNFIATVTIDAANKKMRAQTNGDLEGIMDVNLLGNRKKTAVSYQWEVKTTKRWMGIVAPIAHPLFEMSHNLLMRWGAERAKRYLETVPLHKEVSKSNSSHF